MNPEVNYNPLYVKIINSDAPSSFLSKFAMHPTDQARSVDRNFVHKQQNTYADYRFATDPF